MKLRCTHNSLRIRVRKSDLETLQKNKIVSESVQFAPQEKLLFSLQINEQVSKIEAHFQHNHIVVTLPVDVAQQWINSSQVGIETQQPLEQPEASLHLLIEKDFPCNDRENEDKSDTFWELAKDAENPNIC